MKNFALLLVITLLLSSCSLLNDEKSEDTPTPAITDEMPTENTDKVEDDSTEDMDGDSQESDNEESEVKVDTSTESGYSFSNNTSNSGTTGTNVSGELENDTESEEALNEVFNEIEELFELAEQNGGQ